LRERPDRFQCSGPQGAVAGSAGAGEPFHSGAYLVERALRPEQRWPRRVAPLLPSAAATHLIRRLPGGLVASRGRQTGPPAPRRPILQTA